MIFEDKKGRQIEIDVGLGERASATHNGKEIGWVEVAEYDDNAPATITGSYVAEEYRRAGIGAAMVEGLFEENGMMLPGNRNIGIGGTNALTDDGEALMRHCQEQGYVHPID